MKTKPRTRMIIYRLWAMALVLSMLLSTSPVLAKGNNEEAALVRKAIEETAAFMLKTVEKPGVASVAGEWTVMSLARSGVPVPQNWYDTYYKTVVDYVKAKNGILHTRKYTEYSRVILALTAIGKDPCNVGGYDLVKPLSDFKNTIWQGINGAIFALIALDSGGYEIAPDPAVEIQATREMYVREILSRQLDDGGFAMSGKKADPDITGMALQALARYQHMPEVEDAVDKAVACLSDMQLPDGGYSSWGTVNSESIVQVIMALTALDIDINDSRFVKESGGLLDALMGFYVEGGGFKHVKSEASPNGMATDQGSYGLVAIDRYLNGKNTFYDMSDAKTTLAVTKDNGYSEGPFKNRHPDVTPSPIVANDKMFSDVAGHPAENQIHSLASRGIINGVSPVLFEPGRTMTRAEFAAIVVRALGLNPRAIFEFTDVPSGAWYSPYVGTAYSYGIVNGISQTKFAPESLITRQEAAVMVCRAATLCGLNTKLEVNEIRDTLCQFADYIKSAQWARGSLAFCFQQGVLDQEVMDIKPLETVNRAEIAVMLYRLMELGDLMP
ncbi:MAG: S-layer homology domain-containing protein [Bacillota bacterium]|jgi:hypothetical protein